MKKNEIKLENLIPKSSTFKLKMFKDFNFKLNPCTGGMLIKISQKFGDVEELIGNPSAENVSKLAMMLMEYESAIKFKKQTVKTIDVLTGDEAETEVGGYILFANCIQGVGEQFGVYGAILKSLGYGSEQTDSIIKKLNESINGIVNKRIDESLKKKKQI